MIYTINNCIRAFGYTNFDKLIADMGSVDKLKEYVRANGYADIAVAEDTELLLVDVNGKTWHTGCYGAQLGPEPEYLCFTSTGDSTIRMSQNGTPNTSAGKVIQYKLNNGRWQTWDLSTVTLADGDKMYLKSDDTIPISESTSIYKNFYMNGSIAASGNIMSLVNFSDTLTDYAFYELFQYCTALTAAPALPATTLAEGCYRDMFSYCTKLTAAPELPATTLNGYCYLNMFQCCTSLTTTPELPATSLPISCYYGMFRDCTSLTTAPALPAKTLEQECYESMFENCTSLTTAPALPATTLPLYCYSSMFAGCTSLVQAPELPAAALTHECYKSMFQGCTSLTQAPALPAKYLNYRCYQSMFEGCTSLVQAPELPATKLDNYCYTSMFKGCTSLTQAPALPATNISGLAYYSMFQGCTSLVQAPELPAANLSENCYAYMFKDCTNLNYVKALFTGDPNKLSSLIDWLTNVSPTGTFIKSKDATWTNEQAKIPTGWTVQVEGGVTPEPEPERDYLCFTSTGDSTVAMHQEGTPNTSANKVIQYKLNNGQWQNWDLSAVTLHDGDKMYIKSADEIPMSESYGIYKQFTITGSIAASGNIMSLLNFRDTLQDFGFIHMFEGCTSLTTAPKLQATALGYACCNSMFLGCTSLTTAPELPATTLAYQCYANLLGGCTSLVTAPALPATTLAYDCYSGMFSGCTSLTTAPELHATTIDGNCYCSMFKGCTSLTQAPALPSTTLHSECYREMFEGCTSLTQAPALPATTVEYACYQNMFKGCTSLTTAPELPATTLESYCYNYMFQGCSKLNYVKALFTNTDQNALDGWLNDVSPTGTFVKNAAAAWDNTDAGIPTGWTVQTASADK